MDLERKIKRNYNRAMFKIHKNVREAEEKGIKDKVERNKIRDENQEIYDSAVKAYNRDTKLFKRHGSRAMKFRTFMTQPQPKTKKHLLERKRKLSKFDFGA